MNDNLHISDAGLELIKKFEGVVLKIYRDQIGLETCGIGHLLTPEDKQSGRFNNGLTLTQALDLLRQDVARFEDDIKKNITVELNQNQFDALLSLVFNCGSAPITSPHDINKLLNSSNFAAIPTEWVKWCKASGQVNQGLLGRRKTELHLFLTPVEDGSELSDAQKTEILNTVYAVSSMSIDELNEVV